MALSTRSKLIGALGALLVVAVACGGDDGKSGGGGSPDGGAVAAGAVGKQCTTNTDCGSGVTCNNTQTFGTLSMVLSLFGVQNLPAPGGYCTTTCTSDAQCGTGGVCLGAALGGLLQGECRKACTSNTDCREGYECAMQVEVPTDAGLPAAAMPMRLPSQCQAKPVATVLVPGNVGTPCTIPTDGGVASECGAGFCGGASCSGTCSDDSTCGGGACISNGFYGSAGTCQQTCSADTDCKSYRANSNVGCITSGSKKICGTKVFPLGAGVAGKACAVDSDCGSTGACEATLGLRQTEAPGGYCSVIGCQDDSVCGGGACIGTAPVSACYATCTTDASCRPGYTCTAQRTPSGGSANVCSPGAASDAGTPTRADAAVPPTTVEDAGVPDAG